jgi:hypothetical protein
MRWISPVEPVFRLITPILEAIEQTVPRGNRVN